MSVRTEVLFTRIAIGLIALGVLTYLLLSRPTRTPSPIESATAAGAPTPVLSTDSSSRDLSPPVPGEKRQDIPGSVLSGRLLDGTGSPLAGARLTWTAFDPVLTASEFRSTAKDGRVLLEATRAAESDERGEFNFNEEAPHAREHASVVWVTHPQIESEAVLLEPGAANWHWPAEHAWTPSKPIQVRTVDRQGSVVPGATVWQFLGVDAAGMRAPTDSLVLARKLFVRTYITDAQGSAQAYAVEGWRTLYAKSGDLRSALDWGTGSGVVTLTLLPTFELSGQVLVPDVSVDLRASYLSTYSGDGSGDPSMLRPLMPRIDLRADGGFGPIACPVPELPRLQLIARGGLLLDSLAEQDAPIAGQRVFIRLEGVLGAPLSIFVHDLAGKGIQAAWVGVTMDPGTDSRADVGSGTTDDAGHIQRSVPRTRPFRIAAFKEGFAWVESETTIWSDKLTRLELTLPPACKLTGRVVCQEKPVTQFMLAYWKDDAFRSKTDRIEDKEGRFELAGLPPGKISFFIEPPDYPQSEALTVELRPDGSDEILVELPEPGTARGTVIDAATREPVADAVVTLYSSLAKQILHPRGDSIPVESDGGFTLSGLGTHGDAYAVEAKGYAPCYGLVNEEAGKPTIGVVALQPMSSARIELLLDPGDSPERYSLTCDAGFDIPATPFPAGGSLILEELPPHAGVLSLLLPDGGTELRELVVRVGSAARVVFDERGGRNVKLRFERESAAAAARGGVLRIHELDAAAHAASRTQRISREGEISASRLRLGRCTIEVVGADGHQIGYAGIEVTATGPSEVVVRSDAKLARLRVLDRDRAPLSGVKVEVGAAVGLPPWQARGETDLDGLVEFEHVPCERCLIALMHGDQGSAFGLPIDLSRADGTPIDLVLDARERFSVQVFEGGKAREGVRFNMRHSTVTPWFSTILTSDANGLLESGELNEGTYPLEVSSGGLWPTIHMIQVPQKSTPERIDVIARADLKLEAVDDFDEPQAGVHFAIEGVEVPGDAASWLAALMITSSTSDLATDSDGEFVLHGLPAVTLRWRATGAGGSEAQGDLRLAAGAANELRAKLH